MPARSLFGFGFELVEVSEHFTFLSRRVDPGMPGEVIDERDVVSASAESTYFGQSPYI